MSAVFLDTVGLIALWDRADQWHAAAASAYASIRLPTTQFVTTTYVLLECANAAARRPYRDRVVDLCRELTRRGDLVAPNSADWTEAWEQYSRERRGGAGVIDQVSFHVMRRLGLTTAFTNDAHFRQAGFTTLF